MAQSSRRTPNQADLPARVQNLIDLTSILTSSESEYASQPPLSPSPNEQDQTPHRNPTPRPQHSTRDSPAGRQHGRGRQRSRASSEDGSPPSDTGSSPPVQSYLCMKATPLAAINALMRDKDYSVSVWPVLLEKCPDTKLGKRLWMYLLYLHRNLGELMPRARRAPQAVATASQDARGSSPVPDLTEQTRFLQQRGEFLNRAFAKIEALLESVCDKWQGGGELDVVRAEEIRGLHIPMCVALLKAVFEAATADGDDIAEGRGGSKNRGNERDEARLVTFSKLTLVILMRVCDWIRRLNIAAVDESQGDGVDDSGDSDFEPLMGERERWGSAMEVFEGRIQKALEAILQGEKARRVEGAEDTEGKPVKEESEDGQGQEDLDSEADGFQPGSEAPEAQRGSRVSPPPPRDAKRRPPVPRVAAAMGLSSPYPMDSRDVSSEDEGYEADVASDREMRRRRGARKSNPPDSSPVKRRRVSRPKDTHRDTRHDATPWGTGDSPPTKKARVSHPADAQQSGTPRGTRHSPSTRKARVSHPGAPQHDEKPQDTRDPIMKASTPDIYDLPGSPLLGDATRDPRMKASTPDVYDLPGSPVLGDTRYDISRVAKTGYSAKKGAQETPGATASNQEPSRPESRPKASPLPKAGAMPARVAKTPQKVTPRSVGAQTDHGGRDTRDAGRMPALGLDGPHDERSPRAPAGRTNGARRSSQSLGARKSEADYHAPLTSPAANTRAPPMSAPPTRPDPGRLPPSNNQSDIQTPTARPPPGDASSVSSWTSGAPGAPALSTDTFTSGSLKGASKESTPSLEAPARRRFVTRVVDREAMKKAKKARRAAAAAAAGPGNTGVAASGARGSAGGETR